MASAVSEFSCRGGHYGYIRLSQNTIGVGKQVDDRERSSSHNVIATVKVEAETVDEQSIELSRQVMMMN